MSVDVDVYVDVGMYIDVDEWLMYVVVGVDVDVNVEM